jgi:cytochrome P450
MARPTLPMDQYLADPLAALAIARATPGLADAGPGALAARYHDVRELLADGRLHANFTDFLHGFGITSGAFYDWMAISPLNRDGADHQRWRALMTRTFTPRRVDGLRPFLKTAAHELIDALLPTGGCEFVGAFADVYPSLGLCELIGVPTEDRDTFREWANTIGLGFSPLQLLERIGEVDAALEQLIAYTGRLAVARRAEPRDDLVSRIALAAAEEGGWSEYEVSGFIAGLVFAGHETTKNQLGLMLHVLAGHPAVWDGVATGTLAAADVVEEVMRYRSAVTNVGRTAASAVPFGDDRLEPGERLLLSLWGAARDERVYPRPDALDPVANGGTPHLAFGYGAHHCIGAALARAELQEALAAWAARIGCPRVAGPVEWKPPIGITGLERLPLRFAPRLI